MQIDWMLGRETRSDSKLGDTILRNNSYGLLQIQNHPIHRRHQFRTRSKMLVCSITWARQILIESHLRHTSDYGDFLNTCSLVFLMTTCMRLLTHQVHPATCLLVVQLFRMLKAVILNHLPVLRIEQSIGYQSLTWTLVVMIRAVLSIIHHHHRHRHYHFLRQTMMSTIHLLWRRGIQLEVRIAALSIFVM